MPDVGLVDPSVGDVFIDNPILSEKVRLGARNTLVDVSYTRTCSGCRREVLRVVVRVGGTEDVGKGKWVNSVRLEVREEATIRPDSVYVHALPVLGKSEFTRIDNDVGISIAWPSWEKGY